MKYIANPVEVSAFVITEVGEPLDNGSRWIVMEGNPNCLASPEMLSRMTPVPGDYWVIQSDGYVYLNPKKVFERKYSPAATATLSSAPAVASAPGNFPTSTVLYLETERTEG